jgi:tetratricopeptide (TPR) repeat protein
MNHPFRSSTVVLFVVVLAASSLYSQSPAGYELNVGVQAYKQARYEEAIGHFEKAVALAPENAVAHMYLATAYAQEYIPGVDSPDNDRLAEKAIEQYQHVSTQTWSAPRRSTARRELLISI